MATPANLRSPSEPSAPRCTPVPLLILMRSGSSLSGATAPQTALPTWPGEESYSVLHSVVFLTRYRPLFLLPPQLYQLCPRETMCLQTLATASGLLFFYWGLRFFFFQEWKEKAHSVGSHKSAVESKVMHFTAYDPNTCGTKLAFSHSNWHKMCLGWHFTFTICPSGKIKAVPFSFLGISLSLNSSLNACLCLIIFLRHCFKSSLSPSARQPWSLLSWVINWLTGVSVLTWPTSSQPGRWVSGDDRREERVS